jgi:hypothetical protein
MILGATLIDTYYRRGWLSPGKFIAARGFARDLVISNDEQLQMPDQRLDALKRLTMVRQLLTPEQLALLNALAQDDEAPGSWAKLNGLAERRGMNHLRDALERIVPLYGDTA